MNRFKVLFLFLLILSSVLSARETRITIAATSDVHGALFPYDFLNDTPGMSSLASVHTFTDSVRSIPGSNLILLDNGDLVQGTPAAYHANYVSRSRKNLFSRIMNYMEYDAATVGNHDIEAGRPVYERLREEFNFPWLGANIVDRASGEPAFKPYTVVERDGVRVAVLGLITPGVPNWLPETLWPGLVFRELTGSARYWVKHIREKEQPHAVIGLFHTGMGSLDLSPNDGMAENAGHWVARHVPGLDVIILGHDHRPRAEKVVNTEGREVQIINPGSGANSIGFCELVFLRNTNGTADLQQVSANILSLRNTLPDKEFIRKFAGDMRTIRRYAAKSAGYLEAPLEARDGLYGSAAFTDLIHQVQLESTGAVISFTAPLSVNQNLDSGKIATRDFFKLYRYENFLYVMELSGKEVKDFLEYSFSLWFNTMKSPDDHLLNFRKDENGLEVMTNGRLSLAHPSFNFDSAAGIRYEVDVSKPAGNRVTITGFENGDPFEETGTYRVAVNSYRGSGGGGHLTTGAGIEHDRLKERIRETGEKDIRSLLMDYFRKHTKVNPTARNNWKVVPADWAESGKQKALDNGF